MSSNDIQWIPDWVDRVLAMVYVKFRYLTYWNAYARSLGVMAQAQEDELYQLVADCTLDLAAGAQLDQWGELVGLGRNGLSDNEYRRFIGAQILILRCGGTGDELLVIYSMILGADILTGRLLSLPPASFALSMVVRAPLSSVVRNAVIRAMALAKATGIGDSLVVSIPGYFGWAEDPNALGFDIGIWSDQLE